MSANAYEFRLNPSCASGILFESILRSNDSQNGFHTAKTLSRPLAQGAMNDSSAPGAVIRALANTVIGGRGVTAKKLVPTIWSTMISTSSKSISARSAPKP